MQVQITLNPFDQIAWRARTLKGMELSSMTPEQKELALQEITLMHELLEDAAKELIG